MYNQIVGDTPVLKAQLTNYVRESIAQKNPQLKAGEVESHLAYTLLRTHAPENGRRVDPNQVSIEDLWDASEEHARSWYEKWVWPSVNH